MNVADHNIIDLMIGLNRHTRFNLSKFKAISLEIPKFKLLHVAFNLCKVKFILAKIIYT